MRHITLIFALVFVCTGLITQGVTPVPPQHAGPPQLPLHAATNRAFTGISSLAAAPSGRLWVTWYAGPTPGEDKNNYVVLGTSGDGGKTWKELLTVDPDGPGPHRTFDPEVWIAPDGKLRWFWTDREMPYNNVKTDALWVIVLDDPDSESSPWHPPVYVAQGVMMCKPVALSSGEWALPVCTWYSDHSSKMVVSADSGKTWTVRGGANMPKEDRCFDEHMFIERKDGTLECLSRSKSGIREATSADGGKTWTPLEPSSIQHPSARFFIARLASGHLLLVKHGPIHTKTGRSHLTAYVSTDDGNTWGGGLLLDERSGVSYPDGQQAADGTIYITYDFDRTGARQILFAAFREEDAAAGKPVSAGVRLRQLVSQGSGGREKPKAAGTPSAKDGDLLKGFVHPPVVFSPGPAYGPDKRNYQGIPTIERAPNGRLWAVWYAGKVWEDRYNYVVGVTSGDDGKTWSDLKFAIDPDGDGPLRNSDPCLWLDPAGRLWLFWWLEGNGLTATMAMTCDDPGDENPRWTTPKPLFPGVMLNKPIVLKNGDWLMPAALWGRDNSARVMVSKDRGASFALLGAANIPKKRRNCDEHMLVECKDGSLTMLVRTDGYGIGRARSTDGGRTWTDVEDYLHDATSRFFVRRLASGRWLLVKHGPIDKRIGRSDLTAYLSEDDGNTWTGGLAIDERKNVSYPDGTQGTDGRIHLIYDWERGRDKNILMAAFTEDDIRARAFSPESRSRVLINFATGKNPKIAAAEAANGKTGERLYNGIVLPQAWPPHDIDPRDTRPMPVPYLAHPPARIPIDVGRQLFVDDFLIETNTLARVFHLPRKYENNPILKPETPLELHGDKNSAAVPKSGGVWWDPKEQIFKMWYEAGWIGTICYATSRDGLHWERPSLDVKPGTNQVLPLDLTPDSWTVVPDWDARDPMQRYKLFMRPPGGQMPGYSMTSPDGIHWTNRVATGETGDRSTMFYNPFRRKWVYSLRSSFRGRSRHYWECDDFLKGAVWSKKGPVVWAAADRDDPKDPVIGRVPQLYNLDAVAYESLMLGFFEIHQGPENNVCEKLGLPKITELTFAYSRDGFHWDRPDRRIAIRAERRDVWDRGYVQSLGNLCCVRGDTLWFYYSAFQGDASKTNRAWLKNGMYDRGATGLAFLRRDGFASLEAKEAEGTATTRPLLFNGTRMFVNAVCPEGELRVELLDPAGTPIPPYTLSACKPVSSDGTLLPIAWKDTDDLSALRGKPVRFRFALRNGALYAFWVSRDASGRSDGYVAGGGPGFTGMTDTVGQAEMEAEREAAMNRTKK